MTGTRVRQVRQVRGYDRYDGYGVLDLLEQLATRLSAGEQARAEQHERDWFGNGRRVGSEREVADDAEERYNGRDEQIRTQGLHLVDSRDASGSRARTGPWGRHMHKSHCTSQLRAV